MEEIRNSIFAGLTFGLFMGLLVGLPLGFAFGFIYTFLAGVLSGALFGLMIYSFITSTEVENATRIDTNGKPVLHSGNANHILNGEAVGGKLYLLPDSLIFNSHNVNNQNHLFFLSAKHIKGVKFFNMLGLVPNGLEVLNDTGHQAKFVVSNRKVWRTEICKLVDCKPLV